METKKRAFDLEDKLIDYACSVLQVCDQIAKSKPASHLEYVLNSSAVEPAYLYSEAQSAGSRTDFVEKMKEALSELRRGRIHLRIIEKRLPAKGSTVEDSLKIVNELIGIFSKSVETARKNGAKK